MALFAALAGAAILLASAYSFYKWGVKSFIIYIVFAAGFLFINDSVRDFPALFTPVILGTLGGLSFRYGWHLKTFILGSAAAIAIMSGGQYYYLLNNKNIDLLVESKTEIVKILSGYNIPEDQKAKIIPDMDKMIEYGRGLVVFSTFIYGIIFSALTYVFLKAFFARFTDKKGLLGLEFFRLNDHFIFALIAGLAVFLLADKSEYYILNQAGLNLALIATALYFIQAIGILKFILLQRKISAYWLPLGLVLLLISGIETAFFTTVLLAGFGSLDVWADFRKLTQEKKEENKENKEL